MQNNVNLRGWFGIVFYKGQNYKIVIFRRSKLQLNLKKIESSIFYLQISRQVVGNMDADSVL